MVIAASLLACFLLRVVSYFLDANLYDSLFYCDIVTVLVPCGVVF